MTRKYVPMTEYLQLILNQVAESGNNRTLDNIDKQIQEDALFLENSLRDFKEIVVKDVEIAIQKRKKWLAGIPLPWPPPFNVR